MWNFRGDKKNHVEFPGDLVLGLKICEGCFGCATQFCGVSSSAIGRSFVLSGISRGKKPKKKWLKKVCPQPPPPALFFSGIALFIPQYDARYMKSSPGSIFE